MRIRYSANYGQLINYFSTLNTRIKTNDCNTYNSSYHFISSCPFWFRHNWFVIFSRFIRKHHTGTLSQNNHFSNPVVLTARSNQLLFSTLTILFMLCSSCIKFFFSHFIQFLVSLALPLWLCFLWECSRNSPING